jgi:hypothetical protein
MRFCSLSTIRQQFVNNSSTICQKCYARIHECVNDDIKRYIVFIKRYIVLHLARLAFCIDSNKKENFREFLPGSYGLRTLRRDFRIL